MTKFFIECTQTHHSKANSGIQRVVRGIVKAAVAGDGICVAVPVVYRGKRFVERNTPIPFPQAPATATDSSNRSDTARPGLRRYLHRGIALLAKAIPAPRFVQFLYAPRDRLGLAGILFFPYGVVQRLRGKAAPRDTPMRPDAGDVLVLLDASWDTDYWKAIDRHRARGVVVAVVIHDLTPLLRPEFCTPTVIRMFANWAAQAALRADVMVGNSQATAEDVRLHLPRLFARQAPPPRITHFWLASELDGADAGPTQAPPYLRALAASGTPTYLYVGTIEPRKNHGYALDAFERLWADGVSANFVIAGRIGWDCAAFVARVRAHPQFQRQLFMFNEVDDNGLSYLYATVQGLIFTSFSEGFGLPIVEGLQRALPVFASDIPVFREIGGQGVQYADLVDPAALADAIALHVAQGAPRLPAPMPWLTWEQSLAQLQSRITEANGMRTQPLAPRSCRPYSPP